MREWVEELSRWIDAQEKVASPLSDLSEEVYNAALETDFLLQGCDQLQSAYASLLGKMENDHS